jgi:hypothetical protein
MAISFNTRSINTRVHCDLGNHEVDRSEASTIIVLNEAGQRVGTKYDCHRCEYEEAAALDRAMGIEPEPFDAA